MVGITLSPEQIRRSPPEVRRWLEQQIAGTLGLYPPSPVLQAPSRHLIGCTIEEARAVLGLIQGILPAVSAFFELGREPIAGAAQGLRALRLDDMARHLRLQTPEQVIACLTVIDQALQRVCGQPEATLTALDGAGHCLVADATARSVRALWQEIVAARALMAQDPAPAQAAPAQPQQSYTLSMPAFTAPAQPPAPQPTEEAAAT